MRTRMIAVTLSAVAAACTSGDSGAPATRDSVVQTAPAAAGALRHVASIEGLSAPESAIYDSVQDVWFVTNISGDPGAKDNDGFISRVRADGTIDSLRFAAGGRRGVTLHAPKGTAIVGDTLWVADIDALRGFDTRTGAALTTVELGSRAQFLNDVAAGPDGAVYLTDTESGRVFRVAPDRSVTTALESDTLVAPNGITWDVAGDRFVLVSFELPTLFHWRAGDSVPVAFASTGGGNDGVEIVDGMLLLTSWTDSSLTAVENGEPRHLLRGLDGPADIGVDTRRNRVAIPLLMADRVEIYELP